MLLCALPVKLIQRGYFYIQIQRFIQETWIDVLPLSDFASSITPISAKEFCGRGSTGTEHAKV